MSDRGLGLLASASIVHHRTRSHNEAKTLFEHFSQFALTRARACARVLKLPFEIEISAE